MPSRLRFRPSGFVLIFVFALGAGSCGGRSGLVLDDPELFDAAVLPTTGGDGSSTGSTGGSSGVGASSGSTSGGVATGTDSSGLSTGMASGGTLGGVSGIGTGGSIGGVSAGTTGGTIGGSIGGTSGISTGGVGFVPRCAKATSALFPSSGNPSPACSQCVALATESLCLGNALDIGARCAVCIGSLACPDCSNQSCVTTTCTCLDTCASTEPRCSAPLASYLECISQLCEGICSR